MAVGLRVANMVIRDQWNSYREDSVRKVPHVKEIILDDI